MEVPLIRADGAGLYGQLCDMWDVPLVIVGPGGEDKGKGAKYLIVPPGYTGKIPAGYIVVHQNTYGGFWLMRTIARSNSESDQQAANDLLRKIRVYPLSASKAPPTQRFIDASESGRVWEGIPKMDESFYVVLSKMVNEEPVLPQDEAMMNMLRSIGISKGAIFNPDEPTKLLLRRAAGKLKRGFKVHY
ncbi:MAG: DUF1254 domain-containing protein [Chryseolinea sp.]